MNWLSPAFLAAFGAALLPILLIAFRGALSTAFWDLLLMAGVAAGPVLLSFWAKDLLLRDVVAAISGLLVLGNALGDTDGVLGLRLYQEFAHYDKILHVVGGFGLGVAGLSIWLPNGTNFRGMLVRLTVGVVVTSLAWEVLEAYVLIMIDPWGGWWDSIVDMVADLSGSMGAMALAPAYARFRREFR